MTWQFSTGRAACSRSSRMASEAGFTLLELLVVLAVMAALLVVVPRATAGLTGLRLRGAAYDLAETLRQARDDAVRTGRTSEVFIDAQNRSYLWRGDTTRILPAAADVMSANRSGIGQDRDVSHLRFFADGSATGATITLHQNVRSIAITVEWLTGRVRVDD